ncbi:MAG TPA: hypothetical protein VFY12_06105 [Arenimonas sp.]|nr:hypothetical protein [Arenimonas sp.]
MTGHAGHGWSSEQQRLLGALGYTLYRPVDATPQVEPVREANLREAPPSAQPPATSAPRESRLLANLRRAAGGELAGLTLPSLEQLGRDAAGKRALWPKLRRLRRARH